MNQYQNNIPPKIEFEGEEFQRPTHSFQTQTPKMIQLVMKYSGGHIKDERQAEYVLLGFVVLAIVISLFLIFGGGHTQQKPSDALLEQMKQIQINKQNNN